MRPDGHVAWAAGDGPLDITALWTALATWFGPALRGHRRAPRDTNVRQPGAVSSHGSDLHRWAGMPQRNATRATLCAAGLANGATMVPLLRHGPRAVCRDTPQGTDGGRRGRGRRSPHAGGPVDRASGVSHQTEPAQCVVSSHG
ncbi:hypothetical protein [Streptomyces sp. NPDC058653]|uniref:aromatic-ring hydroxylase C-terminal domain-containing protein n=1 Tax=Streptomyces sp. NPDC058653 TaxID=3346576 RepID=UPI00366491FE